MSQKHISMFRAVFSLAILASLCSSCGFYRQKDSAASSNVDPVFVDTSGHATLTSGKIPGYYTVRALIFQPNCIGCHGSSGGVNLESYASAKAAADRIANEVYIEKSMPKAGPLSESDQAFVRAWVEAGAPENDIDNGAKTTPITQPSPAPSPEPTTPVVTPPPVDPIWVGADGKLVVPAGLVPGYNTVKALVFNGEAGQCLKCHNNIKHKHNVNLETFESTKKFIDRIKNEVYVEKSMPPDDDGYSPLPQDQQDFVKAWIEGGAPEDDMRSPAQ